MPECSRQPVIYALIVNDLVVYVGYTSDVGSRLYNHRRRWPDIERMVVLENVVGDWRERESFWIQSHRQSGSPLRNKTVGGNGREKLSDETRALLSAIRTGRKKAPHTDEAKAKMRAAKLGRKLSPEHRLRIQMAGVGRVFSESTREKLRLASTGKRMTEEAKARRREKVCGRPLSQAHRDAIARGMRGKPAPPKSADGLKRIADAARRPRGPMTDQHRQKIRDSRLAGEAARRLAKAATTMP